MKLTHILKEIIEAKQVGDVYHFTSLDGAYGILTDGFIPEKSVNTFKPMLMVICSKGEKVEKVKELNWNNVIKIQN